jgi:hypothetical protein
MFNAELQRVVIYFAPWQELLRMLNVDLQRVIVNFAPWQELRILHPAVVGRS